MWYFLFFANWMNDHIISIIKFNLLLCTPPIDPATDAPWFSLEVRAINLTYLLSYLPHYNSETTDEIATFMQSPLSLSIMRGDILPYCRKLHRWDHTPLVLLNPYNSEALLSLDFITFRRRRTSRARLSLPWPRRMYTWDAYWSGYTARLCGARRP